jgi:flagellar biosynthesis/type III secretory pathway protein FliH
MEKWTSLIVELSEDRGHQKGQREGRQEGLREGEVKGRQRVIIQQLETKFGAPLPAEKRSQLQHGTDEELDEWATRLLTAASLDDVFS